MSTKIAKNPDAELAVEYRAKSTEDKRGSLGTQRTDNRAMGDREGWEIVAEFEDEGASAFHGNRGRGLEGAKAEAIRIAAERGSCILVCQHSDRIARGAGDAPDAADHLVEVVAMLRRHNVTLRTCQDDHFADDTALLMAAVNGTRNNEDSSRKSRAVRAGKQRQLERGERLGAPVPEGYSLAVERNAADEVVARVYTFDPEREPVIRRIFDLALAGVPDGAIARRLNAEGFRTKIREVKTGKRKGQTEGGVPWDRRRVQAPILNVFYSGRIGGKIDGEPVVVEGQQPGFITREQQDRLMVERRRRDHNQGGHEKVGAPIRNHMIDGGGKGLAACKRCGSEAMYAATSRYVRKSDGGRARTLMCMNVKAANGLCDAPTIRLEAVEEALVAHLDGLFVDFDGWIAAQTHQRGETTRVLQADLDRERQAVAEAKGKEALLADRYTEHVGSDDTLAAADAAALAATRQRREAAEERVADLTLLVAEASAPEPVDAALDWFNDLSASVRGALQGTALREINEGLRQTFRKFWLDTNEDGDVEVLPELHADLSVRLVPGDDGLHLGDQLGTLDASGEFTGAPADLKIPADLARQLQRNPSPIPVLVRPDGNVADGQLYR